MQNTEIDYTKLEKSLKRLQEQFLYYDANKFGTDFPLNVQEAIVESTIQRFETCYDTLWKVLRRHLIAEMGVAEAPNSPKPIFRMANENDLLESPIEQWFKYAQARIDTSHDYDGEKAMACINLIPDFVGDAIQLFTEMTGKEWR